DGGNKMSEGRGNDVGVSESATEMLGKLMRISDELMARYYLLLLSEELPAIHPMDAKKQLARRIVARYHRAPAGDAALEDFNTKFSKGDIEHAEWPVVKLNGIGSDIVSVVVATYASAYQITKS